MFTRILSLVGVLLAVGSAAAQQGQNLYEWSGGWGRSAPAIYAPATPYLPPVIYVAPISPVTTTQAFYPSTAVTPAQNTAVEINIVVPANAKVFFETASTSQGGANRRFVSPPIVPGYDYTYEVRAVWTENGKTITKTRNIIVHAGDVVNLAFGNAQ